MKSLIDSDSKLNYYASFAIDCFLLNILFILTCLPIISIGACLTALSRVTMGMVQGNVSFPIKMYMLELKKNFVRGTFIQLFLVMFGAILFLSVRFLFFLPALSFILVGTGILIAAISLLIISVYIFPYTARYDNKFLKSFKISYQVAVDNPKDTAGIIITLLTIVAMMTLNSFWAIFISFIYFFIGFSLTSTFVSYITLKVFMKYDD